MTAQPANSPAVDRGLHLFTKVLMSNLPHEAVIYAGYLCTKYGMCGEVPVHVVAVWVIRPPRRGEGAAYLATEGAATSAGVEVQ